MHFEIIIGIFSAPSVPLRLNSTYCESIKIGEQALFSIFSARIIYGMMRHSGGKYGQ
jgi:hypothetical protein